MPRKFRKVVCKGYYKKQVVERVPTGDSDEEYVGNDSKFTEAATQTDHMPLVLKIDASTQTDIGSEVIQVMKSIETQTDSETMIASNDMEVEPSVDYVICEGNNDERFQPIIIKHKGIFKDSTGKLSYFIIGCESMYKCLFIVYLMVV